MSLAPMGVADSRVSQCPEGKILNFDQELRGKQLAGQTCEQGGSGSSGLVGGKGPDAMELSTVYVLK